MPPKRQLSTASSGVRGDDNTSEDEAPNVKKVRWNSAATSGDSASESEESENDHSKVCP